MTTDRLRRFSWVLLCLALLCLSLAGPVFWPVKAGARNPCLEPGNLTQNCSFDTFVDDWVGEKRYLIPQAWWYYILAGNPDYRQSDDTLWPPSLEMVSDGVPFTAGIYQQVAVTPGVVYQTDIGWAAPSKEDFERKLGLDPTGGTDPLAPTVIWGRSEWTTERWPDLTVSARATGPTMTVFVWVHHPRAYGGDAIYLDAVGLWPDLSQPAVTLTPVPSFTPTTRPPTRTPSPIPVTDTPTASASATATMSPSATPSPTPTATATVAPTRASTATPRPPTATPYPTRTPLPTIELAARSVPDAGSSELGADPEIAPSLWIVGIAAVAAAVLAGVVAVWALRRKRAPKE